MVINNGLNIFFIFYFLVIRTGSQKNAISHPTDPNGEKVDICVKETQISSQDSNQVAVDVMRTGS